MHRTIALTALLFAYNASAAPTPFNPFPLPNGFPNPSQSQLADIQKAAGGTLPNGPLPPTLKDDASTTLNLIALNELFEVAYFTQLLANVTQKVPGYDCGIAPECEMLVQTLQSVVNVSCSLSSIVARRLLTILLQQEQLHVLSANGALNNAKQPTQQPCLYNFPVSDLKSSIALANTFTDLVLGALPGAQKTFATDGGDELGLIPVVGSIIGQEGEQNGFYRTFQSKSASAAPFLTGVPPEYAFSALQSFFVPGSCPGLDQIKLASFPTLNVNSAADAKSGTLDFSCSGTVGPDDNSIVYLSGQNIPVTVPISPVVSKDGLSHFTADFPFDTGFSKGLTIAAVVKGKDAKFATASDVAAATVFGPGLIQVQ